MDYEETITTNDCEMESNFKGKMKLTKYKTFKNTHYSKDHFFN